jgi:hypothetical protein
MKVDLKNKELPIKFADTAAELSRMCGLRNGAVSDAIRKAALKNRPCKYVRVEIDEEDQ